MNYPILIAIQLVLLLLTVLLFATGLATNRMPLLCGIALWVPALLFLLSPHLLVTLSIACLASELKVPGLPGDLLLFQVLGVLVIAVTLLRVLMKHSTPTRGTSIYRKTALTLGLLIAVTMSVRGAGFRLLGDSQWGGMRYVSMLTSIGMLWVTPYWRLTKRQIQTALKWMCFLALLPFLSEMALLILGNKAVILLYFIRNARVSGFGQAEVVGGIRVFSGSMVAPMILMLPLVLQATSGKKRIGARVCCTLAAFTFAMISGHRISLLELLIYLFVYAALEGSRTRLQLYFTSGLAVVLSITVLLLIAENLPFAIQRTVSWIPFVKVTAKATADASSTVTWRLGVWKDALAEIPQHFWLGKGYTFDPLHIRSLMQRGHYVRDWASVESAYHNGHLSLLIGLGVFGYITGIGTLLLIFRHHLKLAKSSWQDEALRQLHLIVFVRLAIMILMFVTIYGDAYVSLPGMLVTTMILDLIRQTDDHSSSGTPHET